MSSRVLACTDNSELLKAWHFIDVQAVTSTSATRELISSMLAGRSGTDFRKEHCPRGEEPTAPCHTFSPPAERPRLLEGSGTTSHSHETFHDVIVDDLCAHVFTERNPTAAVDALVDAILDRNKRGDEDPVNRGVEYR